jgi:type VI secretion system protein VasG
MMRAVYLRVLTNTVLPRISEEYLARTVERCPLDAIAVRVENGDFSFEFA